MAILIDEYGGFSGIVSIEDIIEQIVGDIADEFDEDDRVIEKISDSEFIVDGNVYLDDLTDELHVDLESENSETVGGLSSIDGRNSERRSEIQTDSIRKPLLYHSGSEGSSNREDEN